MLGHQNLIVQFVSRGPTFKGASQKITSAPLLKFEMSRRYRENSVLVGRARLHAGGIIAQLLRCCHHLAASGTLLGTEQRSKKSNKLQNCPERHSIPLLLRQQWPSLTQLGRAGRGVGRGLQEAANPTSVPSSVNRTKVRSLKCGIPGFKRFALRVSG